MLAWIDSARWRGWLLPWLPDRSVEALGDAYFSADPERAPWRSMTGEWVYTDDEDEEVRLERFLSRVTVAGATGRLALSDTGRMSWCWEVHPGDADAARVAALAELVRADLTIERRVSAGKAAPARRRKGRKS